MLIHPLVLRQWDDAGCIFFLLLFQFYTEFKKFTTSLDYTLPWGPFPAFSFVLFLAQYLNFSAEKKKKKKTGVRIPFFLFPTPLLFFLPHCYVR